MALKSVGEVLRPEVGRYYLVPQLRQLRASYWKDTPPILLWIPVHGPLHEDAEIIGFPHQHYHVDTRFMSEAFCYRYLGNYKTDFYLQGKTYAQEAMIIPVIVNSQATYYKLESPEPVLRKRLCQRETPEFVWPTTFGPKLQAAYANCQLDPENPICPHRGFKLSGLPEKDGVVVCPGHGIRWDLRTGYQSKEAASCESGMY